MKPSINFPGINHVGFATAHMDHTIHFWRDLIGLKIVAALGKQGERQYFFALSRESYLTFFEWPDVKPVPYKHHGAPQEGPFIFDHISIGVEKKDDLFYLQDLFDAAGFPVSDVVDHGFLYSIYSYDPNGIPIEFSWNTHFIDILKTPMIRDPEPSRRLAEQGTEPVEDQWPEVTEPTPEDLWIVIPGEGALS